MRRDTRTIAQRKRARSIACPVCGATPGKPCYDGFAKQQLAREHGQREALLPSGWLR